jgi:hypothetical protein
MLSLDVLIIFNPVPSTIHLIHNDLPHYIHPRTLPRPDRTGRATAMSRFCLSRVVDSG